ncbi:hypothetical protein M569_14168, partial [Genlisea aurea]
RADRKMDTKSALILLVLNVAVLCTGGRTSTFIRDTYPGDDMPENSDVFTVPPGINAPQQVHITQGDSLGTSMIVSWITPDIPETASIVSYWSDPAPLVKPFATGTCTQYTYYNYTSGYIHHTNITDLEPNTKYYYTVGELTERTFWFTTPPAVGPDVPYTFGLIGDLGQTFNSNKTLTQYQENPLNAQALLYVGDLSYADQYPDHDNVRWDTWGRFIERSAAYQPWIWTVGNHEIDFAPYLGEYIPFVPYSHRFHTPWESANSTSPFYYSISVASAHIIVLSSYHGTGPYTLQDVWLTNEFAKVNRSETPWLVVLMHAPFYNSYNFHYMEAETMRVVYEPLFVKYKVDVVFAGHIHAYERSVSKSHLTIHI